MRHRIDRNILEWITKFNMRTCNAHGIRPSVRHPASGPISSPIQPPTHLARGPSACSQPPYRISSTFAHRGIIPSTGIYSTLAQKTSLQQASCPNPTFSKMQRPLLPITQCRRIREEGREGRGRGSRGGRRWGRLGEVRNAAGLGATRHRIARPTRSRRNGPNPLRISTLSASFQS